jgi:pyruvate/2-oxoglutarate dehydrogenase complex dihydrolipoamide acyltransferase (E2) component
VETNKAEVEIPSPYAGRIVELGGAEGDTLTVGSCSGRIPMSVAERRAPVPAAERQRQCAQAGSGRLRGRRRHGHQQARIGR